MHKNFAKTLFLGKTIVKVPECHSTNTLAAEISASSGMTEGTVVITPNQTRGKGQRGNTWLSAPGKNLTFTILFKPGFLKPTEQFQLNMVVSLALHQVVEKYLPAENVQVKWPNDLYVNDKKVAGILIENEVKGNKLSNSFVGIGVNLNQWQFPVETASSLINFLGTETDPEQFLEDILLALEKHYLMLKSKGRPGQGRLSLEPLYRERLRWLHQTRTFQDAQGLFCGEILGVDPLGRLIVKTAGKQRAYTIKEITFVK